MLLSDGMDRVIEQILDIIEPSLLHVSKDNLVATLEPKNFRLQSSNWSVKTSVIVSNLSDRNLYALSIKLAIEDGNLKAEDVEVDVPGKKGTYIRSSYRLLPISGDAIIFNGIDSENHEAILVVISRIAAKQNREIIFSGKRPLKEGEESLASVKICDFKTEPVEFFMEKQGEVALIFQPPENFTAADVRLKMYSNAR